VQAFELRRTGFGTERRAKIVILDQILGERAQTPGDCVEDIQPRVKRGLLGHVGNARAGLQPQRPVVQRTETGQHPQQARLAAAVASDQREPFAVVDLQFGAIEQRDMTVGESAFIESEKRQLIRSIQ
jgi:hypothetical protein